RVQFSSKPFGPSSSVIQPAPGDGDDDMPAQPASITTTHATQHATRFMMFPPCRQQAAAGCANGGGASSGLALLLRALARLAPCRPRLALSLCRARRRRKRRKARGERRVERCRQRCVPAHEVMPFERETLAAAL